MYNFNYKKITKNIRKKILDTCFFNGGHIATSLSCVEILVSLYFNQHYFDKNKILQNKNDRDIFIMSKGHGENALYAVLVEAGFFPEKELYENFRKNSFYLGGHVDSRVPGVEVSTGSLGHGVNVATGLALHKKKKSLKGKIFCLVGDAECGEGSVWEAVIFAATNKLDNLIFIIDDNSIGSLDFRKNYMNINLAKAFKGFGIKVVNANGHNIKQLQKLYSSDEFTVIIAKTIKGKGIPIFENDPIWHVKKVDETIYKSALKELGN